MTSREAIASKIINSGNRVPVNRELLTGMVPVNNLFKKNLILLVLRTQMQVSGSSNAGPERSIVLPEPPKHASTNSKIQGVNLVELNTHF